MMARWTKFALRMPKMSAFLVAAGIWIFVGGSFLLHWAQAWAIGVYSDALAQCEAAAANEQDAVEELIQEESQ